MKIIKSVLKILFLLSLLLIVTFFLGPRLSFDNVNNRPLTGTYTIAEVIQKVDQRNENPQIRELNHEEIVWQDKMEKTKYSIVYLHGFSASQMEGDPVHREVAKTLGANLYLSRLPLHGINDPEAFEELTPELLVEYAKEAIKIGRSLGEELIVMSCSTGGTLSAFLAAADPTIKAQIMFSPNFQLASSTANILLKPWGLQIGRKITGGKYRVWNPPVQSQPFWYGKYRLEGVAAVAELLKQTMSDETFANIKCPTFVGYFYKNDAEQDPTISVEKILEVEQLLGTPDSLSQFKAYPEAGGHVFSTSLYYSRTDELIEDVLSFLKQIDVYKEERMNTEAILGVAE